MEIDDLLPLSGLQHLIYCERQFALIHVEQLWAENALTISGRQLHERADLPGESFGADAAHRPCALAAIGPPPPVRQGRRRGVPSRDGGGRRVVWRPFPVEYKRGRPKTGGADEVQLCAQALCLEEMLGLEVPRGALFYGTTRRRKAVEFTAALRIASRRPLGAATSCSRPESRPESLGTSDATTALCSRSVSPA